MMNSTRFLVLLALPLLCSAGCNLDDHALDELTETVTVLEATSRRVCGIDTLGTLRCAKDSGLVDMFDMADNDYISLNSNNTHAHGPAASARTGPTTGSCRLTACRRAALVSRATWTWDCV
jgi:hypothetical protein